MSCENCLNLIQGKKQLAGYVACRYNEINIDCGRPTFLHGQPRTLQRIVPELQIWIRADAALLSGCVALTTASVVPSIPLEDADRKSDAVRKRRQRDRADVRDTRGRCEVCGAPMSETDRNGKPRRTCSPACRMEYARRIRAGR
jgi:hypothetical protein